MRKSVSNNESADIELTKFNKNDSFDSKSHSITDDSDKENNPSNKSDLDITQRTSKVD
jgi:hypothetical protein